MNNMYATGSREAALKTIHMTMYMDLSLDQSAISTVVDALPLNMYILFLQLFSLRKFPSPGDLPDPGIESCVSC